MISKESQRRKIEGSKKEVGGPTKKDRKREGNMGICKERERRKIENRTQKKKD